MMKFRPSESVRALLSRKDGLSASLSEVLGAISIAVVILGLTGVGITASYNVGQDGAASTGISSVKAAQTTYETKNGSFGTLDQLTSGAKPVLQNTPDNIKLMVSADGNDYCASVKSGSMTGAQWVVGGGGDIIELKTQVPLDQLKGCTVTGQTLTMVEHGNVKLEPVAIPAGATTACLRFDLKPGPGVTRWYVGSAYLDADKKPVPNTKMANPAGGYYSANGAARDLDFDGNCFPVGPEVKYIQWNYASSSAGNYGDGGLNTIGSVYSNIFHIFHS